ncbi:hypothetical protein DEU56DRAFT_862294 [Suillus clintonianus]|uniref:uncharacterized protein n=1 Tax=Suillus clintonianus TaxID=1904413 RepID=UPI001B86817E|nr:uncharacterized protein DEU56DRAFT_862294 [Suillus clintonianus]KAG2126303.1 hypothetical protein DEU56DRAFT_862294 [Suillus clintonianus]
MALAAVSTIQPSRPECSSVVPSTLSPNLHLNIFQRSLAISDLDFKDNRYPTLTLDKSFHKTSPMIIGSGDTQTWGTAECTHPSSRSEVAQQLQGKEDFGVDGQHDLQLNGISGSLPQGATHRIVERYSPEDNVQASGSGGLMSSHLFDDSFKSAGETYTTSPSPLPQPLRDVPSSLKPASNRQSSYPPLDPAGSSRLPPPTGISTSQSYSPAMGITIPISPNPRAYAQHPTYITPAAPPDPINPILSPNPPVPPEEICVECAMRDQDMADVVVVGPGIWERESDVLYEDLLRREQDDEAAGVISSECSSKPRARGGRLSEQNLKIWHTMTPREPASRQQTLDQYVKAQRSLLEAEALAHARAMQESMQLEHKMRDTYSQFRRSAYDLNGGVDDTAFRLKPPHPSIGTNGALGHHIRSPSRDITVLENGLIVEHVDIRKEEKEEERRRRNEKRERRARKSSKGSAVDVTSLYSVHSLGPHTDSGLGPMQSSRYSAISSVRPISSLTAPTDRQPSMGQVYSQASFSDAHSRGSASPRRSRFFGFKNLSAAWRSQDSLAPSGMSGSMIDMHLALHHESNGLRVRSPVGERSMLSTPRHSQLWPPVDPQEPLAVHIDEKDKPKKKRKGLAKIWKLVRGNKDDPQNHASGRDSARSQDTERNEDDLPLAPPPPLSYLVDRGPGEHIGSSGRHVSTPSIPSSSSPRNQFSSSGMSPSTAPSSLLPSPTSSRPSGIDRDAERKSTTQIDEKENYAVIADESGKLKLLHPVISEPDIRQKLQQNAFASTNGMTLPRSSKSQVMLSREKSLPPLPGEVKLRSNIPAAESRPQTLYTYDPRLVGQESSDLTLPHAPFRSEPRRQSFGGSASRPNLGIQTMPLGAYDPSKGPGGMYNEFGLSRRSLGRLEHIDENPQPSTPSKRRSKFGFASLLGRKSTQPEPANGSNSHEFPRLTTSLFEGEDNLTTAYTHSMSRQSAGPRMSVTSRKALEERVEQDREFVAYRYPSHDQRLDILR